MFDRIATQHVKLLKLLYLSTQSYTLELREIKLTTLMNLSETTIQHSNLSKRPILLYRFYTGT